MKKERTPTNSENVTSRLFLRFFICFAAALPMGWMTALRGSAAIRMELVGRIEFLFIPLALLGGILTLTKPYLLLLSLIKGFYDGALLCHITVLTQSGDIGILYWNASFLLLTVSLLIFAFTAARAELFSFVTVTKNMPLLFSRHFGKYLLEALLLVTLAVSICFLWPRIFGFFGL